MLCAIAARTRAAVRASDTLARVGGDELALVGPGGGRTRARHVSRLALHDAVADLYPVEGAPPVTMTISTATYPVDGGHRDALLRAADQRLHAVKDMRAPASAGSAGGAMGAFPLVRS